MKRDLIYYLLAIIIFVILKMSFTWTDNNDLAFLLGPTDNLISLATSSNSQIVDDGSYFHGKLNILIDKSCSGFNFLTLCFLMLIFASIKNIPEKNYKILIFPLVLVLSYFMAILVNSSRILFSVFISEFLDSIEVVDYKWLHQAEGAFVYLFFLVLIYLSYEKLIKKVI